MVRRFHVEIFAAAALLIGAAAPARAAYLSDYTSHTVAGNRVVFRCGVPAVVIEWMDPRVVRMSLHPDGIVAPDTSLAVLPRLSAPVPYMIDVAADSITLRSAALTVVCRRYPFRVRVADVAGSTLLDEPLVGGMAWNGTERSFGFAIGPDRLYGLGERAAPFDRRGLVLGTYNQALYGYGSSAPTMNLNIPLLVSSRGWGLLFDNPWPGTFDLAGSTPGIITGRAEAGPMRLYLIQGPDPGDVLERYTWLTGRPPLPPRWALGYLQSKFGYHDRAEVEALAGQFRTRDLPLDAVVLDLYWFGQPSDMGRMTWDAAPWPNPGQMIANLRADGVRTILIEEPYLITSTANYGIAAANGHLGTTAGGAPYTFDMWAGVAGLVDLTKPAAADWWWGLHRPLLADGVAGWWLDLGEPETHPNDLRHAAGPARAVHNVYNLHWLQGLYDRQRAEPGTERVFLLTRSGFAGMQRTGAVSWSGDVAKSFPALAAQVPMLLGMGLSGQAWHNSDIGGYTYGPTTPELFVRWMQFGAFCPVARAHGSGQDTEPWAFGAEAEAICRRFLKLRQRLLPYSYTLARETAFAGRPLARPLWFEFPQDAQAATVSDEYLWGRSVLVAPVTIAGATSRSVYVPAGRWTDYWTQAVHTGPATVTVPAPLEQMPLLVRAGSILPMQNEMPGSASFPIDTLTLDIFPADTATFTLYEDDGVSYAYEGGAHATTELSFGADFVASRIHIGRSRGAYTGKPAFRTWIVRLREVTARPVAVMAGGEALAAWPDSAAWAAHDSGWWHDAAAARLHARLRRSADDSTDVVVWNGGIVGVEDARLADGGAWTVRAEPNPVVTSTTVRFRVQAAGPVEVGLFDVRGRRVSDLTRSVRRAGTEGVVEVRSAGLTPGVYYVRVRSGQWQSGVKIAVVR